MAKPEPVNSDVCIYLENLVSPIPTIFTDLFTPVIAGSASLKESVMQNSIVCRLCTSERFEPRFTKNGFRVQKCLNCGLFQISSIVEKTTIENSYSKSFFDSYYSGFVSSLPTIQRWVLRILPLCKAGDMTYEYEKYNYQLEEIERRTERVGRLLDVGCGFGYFLGTARERGWETYGIEPSGYASRYAQEKLGLSIVYKQLSEVTFQPGFFDVITMWNVLERLPEPRQGLAQIFRMLRKGGLLVFNYGNVESYVAKVQGKNWRMFSPPGVMTYFSSETVGILLAECKFESVEKVLAFPREKLLERVRALALLKKLKLSDKVRVYARKRLAP